MGHSYIEQANKYLQQSQDADSPYLDNYTEEYNGPQEYWPPEEVTLLAESFDGDHDQHPADDYALQREMIRRRVTLRAPQGTTARDISPHLAVELAVEFKGRASPTPRWDPRSKRPRAGQAGDLAMPFPGSLPAVGAFAPVEMTGHLDEESKGVKYVRDGAALMEKYWVEMGPLMTRRGRVLDTDAIYSHFRKSRNTASAQGQLVQPVLVSGAEGRGPELQAIMDDFKSSLIWVCARCDGGEAAFLSHVCKRDRFHHSSFLSGGTLVGAGQWVVQDGKLLRISGQSGHYLPTLDQLQQSVRLMSAALHADTQVLLFDVGANTWAYMPALKFLYTNLSGYKAHPQEAR